MNNRGDIFSTLVQANNISRWFSALSPYVKELPNLLSSNILDSCAGHGWTVVEYLFLLFFSIRSRETFLNYSLLMRSFLIGNDAKERFLNYLQLFDELNFLHLRPRFSPIGATLRARNEISCRITREWSNGRVTAEKAIKPWKATKFLCRADDFETFHRQVGKRKKGREREKK